MKRKKKSSMAIVAAALAAVGIAIAAQETFDKYSLKSPGGIAFADFRG